jgi:hypothetical protein
MKERTIFSSAWNELVEDETTLILFETSCSISKRYNWAYYGHAP